VTSPHMTRLPTTSTLFPYTTLFRSDGLPEPQSFTIGATTKDSRVPQPILRLALPSPLRRLFDYHAPAGVPLSALVPGVRLRVPRSEEHTSELQSRENLVCRLLLEKK